MIARLVEAISINNKETETLGYWNGRAEAEKEISHASGYEFLITQRAPYHFDSNMNNLVKPGNAEMLIN